MPPLVKVIGYTTFLGVPPELTEHGIATGQDEGSDAARLIECAGRTCYDSYGKGRASSQYHGHILEVGHGSVLEHAVINFYITGISRGCSHEWVRHKAGTAISQRSTRYVDESDSAWAWHPFILKHIDAEALGLLADAETACKQAYLTTVECLQKILVEKGLDKATARKQARGAARGVLGNALETSMVWSANIRAMRNVIEQRCSPFADAEIRQLANRVFEEARNVCPEYFADYVCHPCEDGIGFYVTTGFRKV
jgi:thymidylate synthase (FAD)